MQNEKMSAAVILKQTVDEIAGNIKSFFRALIIPVCLLASYRSVIYSIIVPGSQDDTVSASLIFTLLNSLLMVVDAIILAVIAVSTHRLVVLGNGSLPNRWGIYFSVREIKFIGWEIVCGFPVFLFSLLFITFSTWVIQFFPEELWDVAFSQFVNVPYLLSLFLGAIVLSLIGMVLPSVAIEGSASIRKARRLASGNFYPIFVSLLTPAITIMLLGKLIDLILQFLNFSNSSFLSWFLDALSLFLGVVEIAVLSVIYKNAVNQFTKSQMTSLSRRSEVR